MQKMKEIICDFVGHNYNKEVFCVDPRYKVLMCSRCGKTIWLEKGEKNGNFQENLYNTSRN